MLFTNHIQITIAKVQNKYVESLALHNCELINEWTL